MNKFMNLLRLTWRERYLLFKTIGLMSIIRILIWILPFSTMQKLIKNMAISSNSKENRVPIKQIIWAVESSGSYLPRSTCLIKALTAYILFSRESYPVSVEIGVSKAIDGEFEAHAWLKNGSKTVIGESEKKYVPLLDLK